MQHTTLGDLPFKVLVRPDLGSPDALVLQFEVDEGLGVLGLRKPGRVEPQPTVHYEETDISVDLMRAGRFVHVLGGGQRQSYALSRITQELVRRLPTDRWTELRPMTEYGFRYLVIPEEVANRRPPAAAVTVSAPLASAVSMSSTPSPAPAPARDTLPPRRVPVDPELARAALERLTADEALDMLRRQMAEVEQLHLHVIELENQLEQSRARERDLIELLSRWQGR